MRKLLLIVLTASLALPSETGTHWPDTKDFSTLKGLGYNYAIVSLTTDETTWKPAFDAADAAGLRMIVGLYPPPFTQAANGSWTVSISGQRFLRYASSRSSTVKAIFGFNEPYWTNPFTGSTSFCGNLSASDLRNLRTAIRQYWPDAKVYHDLGLPSNWAPTGVLRKDYACIGDKYADQSGVADYVGIWAYPFDTNGRYSRAESLATLTAEVAFVRTQMKSEPVLLGQSFLCQGCGEASRFPTPAEIQDWNCALRTINPESVSWYVWKQTLYPDYLSRHPEHWSGTVAGVCPGFGTPQVKAAAAAAEVAINTSTPGAILSLYGTDLSAATLSAASYPLPRNLAEVSVQLDGTAVPLYYVSPTQINIQIPWEATPGSRSLTVLRGGKSSPPLALTLRSFWPSLFSFLFKGLDLVAALNAVTGAVVTTDAPIRPGEIVSLFASGLGALADTSLTGQPFLAASPVLSPAPRVYVGGVEAAVLYAGSAPGFAGVYQINARLPQNLGAGNFSIWLDTNGTLSNGAILPVR